MRIAICAALAAAILITAGCTRVPRFRTLPKQYQTIYIPMVKNKSVIVTNEEVATRKIQEEFMADGRLTVSKRGNADIVCVVEIVQIDQRTVDTERDDFPRRNDVSVWADVFVFQRGAVEPFGEFRGVTASVGYGANTRRSTFTREHEWTDFLYTNLALQVVTNVITGPYGVEAEEPIEGQEQISPYRSNLRVGDNYRQYR